MTIRHQFVGDRRSKNRAARHTHFDAEEVSSLEIIGRVAALRRKHDLRRRRKGAARSALKHHCAMSSSRLEALREEIRESIKRQQQRQLERQQQQQREEQREHASEAAAMVMSPRGAALGATTTPSRRLSIISNSGGGTGAANHSNSSATMMAVQRVRHMSDSPSSAANSSRAICQHSASRLQQLRALAEESCRRDR